jgi:acyl carrier protein
MSNEIMEKVVDLLMKEADTDLEKDKITESTRLRDDLGLDSMQAVTLIMDMEDEFDISVEDEEVAEIKTVGELVKIITEKQSGE